MVYHLFIFSRPTYLWGVSGAIQVGASKHLDPVRQRVDALAECQGETKLDLQGSLAT